MWGEFYCLATIEPGFKKLLGWFVHILERDGIVARLVYEFGPNSIIDLYTTRWTAVNEMSSI